MVNLDSSVDSSLDQILMRCPALLLNILLSIVGCTFGRFILCRTAREVDAVDFGSMVNDQKIVVVMLARSEESKTFLLPFSSFVYVYVRGNNIECGVTFSNLLLFASLKQK